MRPGRSHIIFIPTWRCNLRCHYCDYETKKKRDLETSAGGVELHCFGKQYLVGPELEWPFWIVYLYPYKPYHLEITGGEPLLYEGLAAMLDHLPSNCTWGITSNTLIDVTDFESYNCRGWTASYHFKRDEEFFGNIRKLRMKGFNVRITLVVTPENHKDVERTIEEFRRDDFPVNIHPLLKQGFSWADHREIYQKFRAMHDGKWVNFVEDLPDEFKGRKFGHCEAGMYYFTLWPDGTVHRCYTASVLEEDRETVKIMDWIPSKLIQPCGKGCFFPCDISGPKKA